MVHPGATGVQGGGPQGAGAPQPPVDGGTPTGAKPGQQGAVGAQGTGATPGGPTGPGAQPGPTIAGQQVTPDGVLTPDQQVANALGLIAQNMNAVSSGDLSNAAQRFDTAAKEGAQTTAESFHVQQNQREQDAGRRDTMDFGRTKEGDTRHSYDNMVGGRRTVQQRSKERLAAKKAAARESNKEFAKQNAAEQKAKNKSGYARRLASQEAPGDRQAAENIYKRMMGRHKGVEFSKNQKQELQKLFQMRLRHSRLKQQQRMAKAKGEHKLAEELGKQIRDLDGKIKEQEKLLKNLKVPDTAIEEKVEEKDLPEEDGLEEAGGEEGAEEGPEGLKTRETVVKTGEGADGRQEERGEGAEEPPAVVIAANFSLEEAVVERGEDTFSTGGDKKTEESAFARGAKRAADVIIAGGGETYKIRGANGFRALCRRQRGGGHSLDDVEMQPGRKGRGGKNPTFTVAHVDSGRGEVIYRTPGGRIANSYQLERLARAELAKNPGATHFDFRGEKIEISEVLGPVGPSGKRGGTGATFLAMVGSGDAPMSASGFAGIRRDLFARGVTPGSNRSPAHYSAGMMA